MRQTTLRLKLPIGYTFVISLMLFSLFLGILEMIARTQAFQSKFVAPGVGSRHRQFEIQLERLEKIVEQDGGIHCIFLGNSMVWQGFNPVAFAQAYQNHTGKDLQCFNFGVDGLTAAAAGPLAEILVNKYDPKLLVYGTDPRDYAVPSDALSTSVILETAWVQYQLGNFSVTGWLYENSYIYRYRRPLRDLLQFKFYNALISWNPRTRTANQYGFDPDATVASYINQPPSPDDERGLVQYYFKTLSNYQILPENLLGLQQVVEQNRNGVQVLVVEMPTPHTYLYFFSNREQDYQKFRQQISDYLEARRVQFLLVDPTLAIPDDGWTDYSHLNTNGALIFSEWLGRKMGEATKLGIIHTPPESPH